MESPSHMTLLSQCWKLDCPPPNEAKGKKRVDMLRTQLHKFDNMTKQHKVSTTNISVHAVFLRFGHTLSCPLQVKEKSKPPGGDVVKTEQSIVGMSEVSLSSYISFPFCL